MFSLAPWLNESMCPWLPGESRALCQVTLQLHSSSMWFMGLQSQHRPALCCLPPGFLQLIIFPVYWKKSLSRNESGSSCAISTCTTFGQNLMHPIAIFLCYGLAELVPPSPNLRVSQLTHWHPVSRSVPLWGFAKVEGECCSTHAMQPPTFLSLLTTQQGPKHDVHQEPASKQLLHGKLMNVSVAHRLCADPLNTGGLYGENETLA